MVGRGAGSGEGLVVLAIDVGSSSVRANLFDGGARRLGEFETQITYEVRTTGDGGVEIGGEELLETILSAVDGTLGKAGVEVGGRIAGVGMCSLVSNVVGVDRDGGVVTPVYTWADTRASAEATELRGKLDEEEVRERTGCPVHTSYLPARLLWLKRTMPEVFGRVYKWVSVGDLVYMRLFREARQSLSVASWGGLLNRHTLDWDGGMLGVVGLDCGRLPLLVDVGEAMRGLRGEFGERWPALKDGPWFPCAGDGVTSNLGSGCIGPEEVAVQVGTSGAMRALVRGEVGEIPQGLWCYRMDRETALVGGALSEGGNLFDWLYGTWGVGERERVELEREVARMGPDGHGLTVLPFVAGERSPGWRGEARAVIAGVSLASSRAEVVRACQEAMAYRFGLVFELLREVLPPVRRIVASGGALLGVEGWVQVLADVLGVGVTASGEAQASSRGTAMLVLRELGLIGGWEDVEAEFGEVFEPDMGRHERYRRGMERQVELYRRVFG